MPLRGQYELEQQVAEGSTGVVWRARHVELGTLAAVKVLREELRADPLVVARFLQEARTLAGLEHPGIVKVFDVGDDWIALEWVDGAPLDDVLAARGPLRPEQAVALVRQALLGLAAAHGLGVVHGDVATSNVLLATSGASMLVDFGLACPTGTPGVCGTPAFVSPEAASGSALTPASDVWSAAAVLYLLLTGSTVLPGADVPTVLARHRDERVPSMAGHGTHLAAVLSTAMASAPTERYPEAGAFLRALEDAADRHFGVGWLAGAGLAGLSTGVGAGGAAAAATTTATITTGTSAAIDTGAVAPPGPPPPPVLRKRPRLPKAPVVAAVVVVVAAIATPIVLRSSGSTSPSSTVPQAKGSVVPAINVAQSPAARATATGAADAFQQLTAISSDTAYLGRFACSTGQQVQTAAVTIGSDEVPLTFVGSDVWLAPLTPAQAAGISSQEPVPHGTCGSATPTAVEDPLHSARVAVETPEGLTGSDRAVQVVARPDESSCDFGAPVLRMFWLHGFLPSTQSFDDGGFALASAPGMETTPLTKAADGTFVLDLTDREFVALSDSEAHPDNVFTSSQYGDCDFASTPPG